MSNPLIIPTSRQPIPDAQRSDLLTHFPSAQFASLIGADSAIRLHALSAGNVVFVLHTEPTDVRVRVGSLALDVIKFTQKTNLVYCFAYFNGTEWKAWRHKSSWYEPNSAVLTILPVVFSELVNAIKP